MPALLMFDTDVLVDYLRGQPKAIKYLEGIKGPVYISVLTVAELYAGVRGKTEEKLLEQFLEAFQILDAEMQIAVQGGLYRRDYGKSHGVGLADAMIAATAERADATLVTLNKKHYPMLKNITVPYRKV